MMRRCLLALAIVFAVYFPSICDDGPTATMFPPLMTTEPFWMSGPAIVRTVPPVMRMSAGFAAKRRGAAKTIASARRQRRIIGFTPG